MIELTWQVMMGVGLAASAGLRAFLPLLVVGLAGRFELIDLSARFEWMSTAPALTVFAVAVVLEILGDKVPVFDHLLDGAGSFARPIAGAIVAASPITSLDPLTGLVVGIVLGGSVAGGVHAAKASVRLISTGGSAGAANPIISVGEDAISLSASMISLVAPIITFTLAVATLYFFGRMLQRRRSRARARA